LASSSNDAAQSEYWYAWWCQNGMTTHDER
jgi:hypothetical protein